MVWMLECVIKVYKPEAGIFPQSLHKILFMVQSEEYWRTDGMYYICIKNKYIKILNYIFCLVGWPDEASRNLYIKATQEIPLLQDTLCHIFVIGISKQHPINGRDIIDLVDVLVKRAAGLHPLIADDFQVCTDFQNYYRVLYKAKVLYTSVHCSMLIVSPRKVTLVNCH